MTEFELQILDIVQDAFPIVERPYAAIAEVYKRRYGIEVPHSEPFGKLMAGSANCEVDESNASERFVFETVESLRASGIIRRLGGVYDSKRLGLVSRLCAGRVPSVVTGAADDSALDQFAAAVMNVPAITHNYVRSHEYNVWFTVIAESEVALQGIIEKLCADTALHDVHSMPAKKMFKINTVMSTQRPASSSSVANSGPASMRSSMENAASSGCVPANLSDYDRSRIRLLSGDLPHSLTPFNDLFLSANLGGTKDFASFLMDVQDDISSKRMRRFGAVLRHQNAGFPSNAMVCFDVTDASAAGYLLAANPHVSHCYERPPFEGFPYNVYAMFHAQSDEELSCYVQDTVKALGCPDYAVLHSVRELKKTSYKYFAD